MSIDLNAVWSAVWGVFLGGIITIFASRHYYMKSSKELKEEAGKLRNLIRDIGIFLQNTGLSEDEFTFDEKGNIKGLMTVLKSLSSRTETRATAHNENEGGELGRDNKQD